MIKNDGVDFMAKLGKDNGENFTSNIEKISILAVLFIGLVAVLLFIQAPTSIPATTQLQHFSSYNDLVDYFSKANTFYPNYYRGGIMDIAIAPTMATAGAVEKTAQSAVSSATDFSKTNVQVAGVDEADILKNDGKYIYAIAQGKLFIVDAYPAENAKIISTVDLNNSSPIEMFI